MSRSARRLIILIAVAAVVIGVTRVLTRKPAPTTLPFAPRSREFLTNGIRLLEEHEAEMAAKHWGPERLAQKHGAVFEQLWDKLNAVSNRFSVLKDFPVPRLVWSARAPAREIAHGIRILEAANERMVVDRNGF